MTSTQLAALEWAIDTLGTTADESSYSHIEALCDLFDSSRATLHAFDTGKSDLIKFMRKFAITIPQSEFDAWRMVPLGEQRVGQIHALPESYGILRATNGILCYIEQSNSRIYGPAHYEFFEPSKEGNVQISHNGKPKVKRESELDKQLAELFAAY
jgi:hypothetical protein